jgi:hypothetical protein
MIKKRLSSLWLVALLAWQWPHVLHSGSLSGTAVWVAPPDKIGQARPLRYRPEGDAFVIVNGQKRFNRALYGTNTAFRVKAGDLPEFLLYLPNKGGNLKLGLSSDKGSKWLIEAGQIKAIYRPGAMLYEIRDPLLGGGTLRLQVLAMAAAEGMLLSVETTAEVPDLALIWAYGGASGHRPSRDGDIGADPEEGFYLHPEHCKDNAFQLNRNSFLLDFKIRNEAKQIYGIVSPASVLDLPLNPNKKLKSLTPRTLANDVAIGLMGVTLVRNGKQ